MTLVLHTKISELCKTGQMRYKLLIKLEESHELSSKDGKPFYKFLFTQGSESIWAYSKSSKFFKELQVHHCYELYADINIKLMDTTTTTQSSSKFELWLNKWIGCMELDSSGDIIQTIPAIYKHPKDDDNKVNQGLKQILALDVYRYMGCVDCTKSIRFPNKELKFICGRCRVEKERKLCFVTRQLILLDVETNQEISVVAYDQESTQLFGRKASDFGRDEDVRNFVEDELVGQLLYLDVIQCQSELVAKNLRFLDENNNNFKEPTADGGERNFIKATRRNRRPPPPPSSLDLSVGSITKKLEKRYDILPGLALIVNNLNYPDKQPPQNVRDGSEMDVLAIVDLLNFLNIDVFDVIVDPTREELHQAIRAYKAELIRRESKSSMIYLMGHGTSGRITLTDNESVNYWSNIIYGFSDNHFPQFAGNLKMFFIQSCQVWENPIPDFQKDWKINPSQNMTDVLVVKSSLPGLPSYLYPNYGSIFIQTFCRAVRKWREKLDLVQILKCVQEEMRSVEVNVREMKLRQVLTYDDICLFRIYL